MKKNLSKIITILTIFVMTCTMVFASSYIPTVDPSQGGAAIGEAKNIFTNITGVLMWLGYAIAVGMIVFIGIKYIMSAPDEKASMKGALVKVVVGGLIIALSVTIVNIVLSVAQSA